MKAEISLPIVDLRAKPIHLTPHDFSNNPLRLSQLLYKEIVTIKQREGEWLFIEADEQLKFSKEMGWHSYPGWVHISEVAEIERAAAKKRISFSRQHLMDEALKFIDAPYLWGGTSYYSQSPIGSVDCSGLSYLTYKSQGILIPRDAHDQFLKCQKIEKDELQPGDLIFWAANEKRERMTHVVLYYNRESYLEAPETGKKVRLMPLPKDFFEKKEAHHFPDREKLYYVTCGSFH